MTDEILIDDSEHDKEFKNLMELLKTAKDDLNWGDYNPKKYKLLDTWTNEFIHKQQTSPCLCPKIKCKTNLWNITIKIIKRRKHTNRYRPPSR